jgi:glycerol-3-phosphate acyltransferase PlsY
MAALTLLAVLIWKGATPLVLLLWADIVLIVVAKHHENIRRLLKGTESPLWGAKKEQAHG